MKKSLLQIRRLLVLTAIFVTSQMANAATATWQGGGADQNWDTTGNWTGGGGVNASPAAADTAVFGNTGTSGDSATVNNIVDVNYTITALTYNQNGASVFHVTQIPTGVTLTASGAVTVGGLPAADGTLTPTYMTGAGTFVATGTPFTVIDTGSGASSSLATLDLSALSCFIYNNSIGVMNIANATSGNRFGGLLRLAGVSNNVTAATINFFQNNASNGGNGSSGIQFGSGTNIINVGTFNIVGGKNSGTVQFVSGAPATAGLRLRGVTGNSDNSSRANLTIAVRTSTGTGTTTGTLGLNGHPVDIKIGNMTIGQDTQSGGNAANGTLNFDTGTIDASNIVMGVAGNSAVTGATGTINVGAGGTLIIGSGGISLVNQTAGIGTGNLNINGGAVIASNNVIKTTTVGTGNITINSGGSLKMVSGTIGSASAPIDNLNLTDSTLTLPATAPANVNTLTPGGSANTINISSLPAIGGYPLQVPVIKYVNPIGGDGGTSFVLGTLPAASPSFQGYIFNNTANSTIDVVVTNGPAPAVLIQWTGLYSGNWDTTTTNWQQSGTPKTYSDATPVQLDDTATGATNINLTTTLSPGSLTVTNNSLIYTFTGPGKLSGTTGLSKQGSGTLIIANSGTNDFLGGISLGGGTLQVGDGGTNGNLPLVAVTDNANLVFNRSNNIIFPNIINGTGALTKNGNGILTLTAASGYAGRTTVNAGSLLVNNALSATSLLTNAVGTTLGGTGVVSGPVSSKGRINPGQVNVAGTLSLGALTLNSGATLGFDLGSDASTVGNGVNDLLTVNGDLNLNNNVIQVNFLGTPQTGSSYHVLDYTGSKNGNFNPTVSGTHFTATVDESNGGQVLLAINGSGANLKWNSTASAAWDSGVSANWLNTGTSLSDVFFGGDTVLFDDSVVNVVTNITLASGVVVAPASITNNSTTKNYTISGAGKISGSASLIKTGGSTLTLGTANDFTGIVTIRGGTLNAPALANGGAASSIGASTTDAGNLVLDGGTLKWTGTAGVTANRGFTLTASGGTIDASPNSTNSGINLNLSGTASVNFPDNGSRTLTLAGTDPVPLVIGGHTLAAPIGDSPDAQPTTLVKNGNNAWLLSGANSYSGGSIINAGRIRTGNASAFGSGPVTVASGGQAYLNTAATFGNNFSLAGIGILELPSTNEFQDNFGAVRLAANGSAISGTVTLTGNTRISARGAVVAGGTISGQITGNFSLELGHGGGTGASGSGNGIITLSSSANDWSGNTIISHGVVKLGGSEVIPNGAGKGNLIMNGSGVLPLGSLQTLFDLNGQTETINGLTSSNNATLCVITNGGGSVTLTVGDNNASGTFGGSILNGASTVAITKIGTGTQTLTGTNAYTGDTLANAGTLIANGSLGLVTVAANATFGGTAAIAGDLTVNSGGTLLPGGSGAIGALTVSGQALLQGTNYIEINKANAATNDQVLASGSISYTGTLIVTNINPGTPVVAGDTFKVFNGSGYSGAFTMPSTPGVVWNTNNLTLDGTLTVQSATTTPSQPRITSISVSGTTLTIQGTNGAANGTYVLLATTNVALPLNQWTRVLTNTFNGSGNLNLTTNIVNPATPQRFYILSQ